MIHRTRTDLKDTRTLPPFAANLDFSAAAACRTIAAATASGTIRFVSEYDDLVGDLLSQSFSFSVANRTIPVAKEVTIRAGVGGHTARPNSGGDSDLVSRHGQAKTQMRGFRERSLRTRGSPGCTMPSKRQRSAEEDRSCAEPICDDTKDDCWRSSRSCRLPSPTLKRGCQEQEAGRVIWLTKQTPMLRRNCTSAYIKQTAGCSERLMRLSSGSSEAGTACASSAGTRSQERVSEQCHGRAAAERARSASTQPLSL
jgi:hypothetical protein